MKLVLDGLGLRDSGDRVFRITPGRLLGARGAPSTRTLFPKTTTLFVSPTAKSILGNGGFNCPCLRIETGGTFVRWGP